MRPIDSAGANLHASSVYRWLRTVLVQVPITPLQYTNIRKPGFTSLIKLSHQRPPQN